MNRLMKPEFTLRALQNLKVLGMACLVASTSLIEASRPRITITGDSIVRAGSQAVIDVTIQNLSHLDIFDSTVLFEGYDEELLKLVAVSCEGAGVTLSTKNNGEVYIKKFLRNHKSRFKLIMEAGSLRSDEEFKSLDLMVSIYSKRLRKTTAAKPLTIYTLKEIAQ